MFCLKLVGLSFHLRSIEIYTHKSGALKWFVSCFLNTVPLFAVLGGSTKQSFKQFTFDEPLCPLSVSEEPFLYHI